MAAVGAVRDNQGVANSVETESLARYAVEEHNKKEVPSISVLFLLLIKIVDGFLLIGPVCDVVEALSREALAGCFFMKCFQEIFQEGESFGFWVVLSAHPFLLHTPLSIFGCWIE